MTGFRVVAANDRHEKSKFRFQIHLSLLAIKGSNCIRTTNPRPTASAEKFDLLDRGASGPVEETASGKESEER